ncbi:type VII secretion-associated protein [Corynebacterium alimapuense]|uniref:type VII secretion-associated protein n=1 Tax=Corynebacterium alimapuense TaxID=1576874 RepID=UPI001403F6AD|nr:type VII secretion-associated protein [Corynebacterium alimapuense]
MSAPTVPGTLSITVLETATIFEGPDTVYRYDLPGSGIIDGWALPAVIDQARELGSLHWPEVEVVVDADGPTTEILTRTLLNKGVAAYPAEVVREHPLPPDSGEIEITRPTDSAARGRHRISGGGRLHPFHLVLAVVVVVVVGVSWWIVDGAESSSSASGLPTFAEPTPSISSDLRASGSDLADPSETLEDSETAQVILEHSGLRIAAPGGFRIESRDDGLLATGDDPNLRIHLAAEPVYSVPSVEVLKQVTTMVEADETLEGLESAETPDGQQIMRYRELPGDGSEVSWGTWVEAGRQFSVGCQTRQQPTLPQEAACAMVLESMELTG